MWKILRMIQKNLVWSIPLSMILGLLFGNMFNVLFLKSWIVPLTFLMVYPMMVTINLRELLKKGDGKLQAVVLLINFGITPFLGYFIGNLFFPKAPLVVVGLLLTSLLPTSGMTISWTGFAKGNMSAAVKMTVIGLIVGSLVTPFYLKSLMGTVIKISLSSIFFQISTIVFLPLALGLVTQYLLASRFGKDRFQKEWKPKFPLFSTLGVLGIVFVSMALKAKTILTSPSILAEYLIPLLLLYGVNFVVSTMVGRLFFKRADGIALVYGTVMRNLSIALAIAMGAFGESGTEIALIISVAYIIQVQAGAWYVKLTDRLFGPVSS